MPTVTVNLPATMTSPEPAAAVTCRGGTVREALRDLVDRSPRYTQRVFYKDRLLVSIVLNGAHLSPVIAQETELHDDDVLELVIPVAGG